MRTWTVLGLGGLLSAGLALAGCTSTTSSRPTTGTQYTQQQTPRINDMQNPGMTSPNSGLASRTGNQTGVQTMGGQSLASQTMGGGPTITPPNPPQGQNQGIGQGQNFNSRPIASTPQSGFNSVPGQPPSDGPTPFPPQSSSRSMDFGTMTPSAGSRSTSYPPNAQMPTGTNQAFPAARAPSFPAPSVPQQSTPMPPPAAPSETLLPTQSIGFRQ